MISGSPDVVTTLIDKKRVAHNGMIDEPVSFFLPSLICKTSSCLLCLLGRAEPLYRETAFFPNLENGPVINQTFGRKSSLRLSIYLALCENTLLIDDILQALPRCFGRRVGILRLSLNYRATIPLAVERLTPNVTVTNK